MKTPYLIDELLGKHFAHEPLTDAQQETLGEWISTHPEEYKQLQLIMENAEKNLHKEWQFDAQRAWEKVSPRLKERRHTPIRSLTLLITVAATVAIVWMFLPKRAQATFNYRNTTASVEKYMLPDSSEITLFPQSSIEGRIAQDKGRRNVCLEGKAYFDVRKANGRSFIVQTQTATIEVLGTSFTIEAVGQTYTDVKVRNGRVKVSSEHTATELIANEQAKIEKGKILKSKIQEPETVFGFVEQQLVFHSEPVENIVYQIEQFTGVEIELDQRLHGNLLTTTLDISDIESVIEELAYLCKCDYTRISATRHQIHPGNGK